MKNACLAVYDSNGDKELSYEEAALVTDLSLLKFPKSAEVSFNEFKNFISVTSIPNNFFEGSKLTSVSFPRNLSVIGEYAFNECTKLSQISLPENIELKYGAFRACTGLTQLTVPGSISWTTDAFYKCSGLRQVSIREGVDVIPDCAFQECTNLSYISLPNSLTKIKSNAFRDCKSLTSITIPANVAEITSYVFHNCISLMTIYCKPQTLPEGEYGSVVSPISNCIALNAIYVPMGSKNNYITSNSWKQYSSLIIEQ